MSPIYEYGCPGCGHKFDVIQKFGDSSETLCSKCKTVANKLISIANHSFGWRFTQLSHELGAEDELERNV